MILTPKMFRVKERIDFLKVWLLKDPDDYLLEFEVIELELYLERLARIERLGLKIIRGGKQSSNPFTLNDSQIS